MSSRNGTLRKQDYLFQSGYRHLDCASLYGNQANVGEAIKEVLEEIGLDRWGFVLVSLLDPAWKYISFLFLGRSSSSAVSSGTTSTTRWTLWPTAKIPWRSWDWNTSIFSSCTTPTPTKGAMRCFPRMRKERDWYVEYSSITYCVPRWKVFLLQSSHVCNRRRESAHVVESWRRIDAKSYPSPTQYRLKLVFLPVHLDNSKR